MTDQAQNYLNLFHELLRETGRKAVDREAKTPGITKAKIVLSDKDFKIPGDFADLYKKAALELIKPKSQMKDRKKHLKDAFFEILKKRRKKL